MAFPVYDNFAGMPFPFRNQATFGVCRRSMGLISSGFASKIHRRISRIVRRGIPPFGILLRHRFDAFEARPRLHQGAIHRKMLIADQAFYGCLADCFQEEFSGQIAIQEPFPILGKGGMIPNAFLGSQSHKPPKQHVVFQLLHEQALAPDGKEVLQEKRPEQHFWRDARTAIFLIQLVQINLHFPEGAIGHGPDFPEGMGCRHHSFNIDEIESGGILGI